VSSGFRLLDLLRFDLPTPSTPFSPFAGAVGIAVPGPRKRNSLMIKSPVVSPVAIVLALALLSSGFRSDVLDVAIAVFVIVVFGAVSKSIDTVRLRVAKLPIPTVPKLAVTVVPSNMNVP
jgi:hypothetical protein